VCAGADDYSLCPHSRPKIAVELKGLSAAPSVFCPKCGRKLYKEIPVGWVMGLYRCECHCIFRVEGY
jgi:hypothetical protein